MKLRPNLLNGSTSEHIMRYRQHASYYCFYS